MSKWAVFEIVDAEEFHVYPCTDDGDVLGHDLGMECWCSPRIDDQNHNLIIHNDPKLGGLDS